MKKTIFILFFIAATFYCMAQKSDSAGFHKLPKNSFYIELLGSSIVYSLNYERIFVNKNKFYLSGRIGSGFIPLERDKEKIWGVPLLINSIYQLNKNFSLELGFGTTLKYNKYIVYYGPKSGNYVSNFNKTITAFGGIRVQWGKGYIIRTGAFIPFSKTIYEGTFVLSMYSFPIGGISFGYNF